MAAIVAVVVLAIAAAGARFLGLFAADTDALRGSPIEPIAMHDLDGHAHRFAELGGKRSYVYFWASWCGPCAATLRSLKSLPPNDRLAMNFVTVALDDDPEAVRQAMARTGFHGTSWIADRGMSLLQQRHFGNTHRAVPFLLELDAQGRIVAGRYGVGDHAGFLRRLETGR